VRRTFSTIIAWPRIAGIADFRLPIFPPWRADEHWKELPHHFFNRQSAIKTFIFNNIPAFSAHLLCFHIHSRLGPGFSTAVLCFQQHSRVARSKKEFFLTEADFLSS
jgi:hypothetical protein